MLDFFRQGETCVRHILLLILAALSLTTTASNADEDSDESKVVAKVELLGGRVTRDESLPGNPVIGVDFRKSKRLNNKFLYLLKSFKHLTTLDLSDTTISDAGMKEIHQLASLKSLTIARTGITDAGMQGINKLSNLTSLNLQSTRLINVGFKEICELKNLTDLNLMMTRVRNIQNMNLSNLENLKELKDIKQLYLGNTQATAKGRNELSDSLPTLKIIQ